MFTGFQNINFLTSHQVELTKVLSTEIVQMSTILFLDMAAEMAGTSTESKGDVAATITSDSNLGELPFQVQIHYTDLEGAQAMRVLTQTKPVTRERIQAEDCEFRYLDFVFAFLYRNCEFTITLSDVEMMQCCNVV